jgi:hypothetical protein
MAVLVHSLFRSTNVTVNALEPVPSSGLIILSDQNLLHSDQPMWPITDGMRALCVKNPYAAVTQIEIVSAGVDRHDGRHPHVWYVTAKVWADKRPDGEPVGPRGYYAPGSYFVRVPEGWVHIEEGYLPHLIGMCMEVFGLT